MSTLTAADLAEVRELRNFLAKYSPDQPRDDHGRFGSGGTAEPAEGSSRIGQLIRGDANNAKLESMMYEGLYVDTNLLDDIDLGMGSDAKAEVVAARGADLAEAAKNDPDVRAEMQAQYLGTGEGGVAVDRDNLERDFLDSWGGLRGAPPDVSTMSDEELYGAIKAQEYVDKWADTAADNDADAHAMQMAVAAELDAPSTPFDSMLRNLVVRDPAGDEQATMRAFVRSEYNATQDYLRQAGIGPDDPVTLYRGVHYGIDDVPSPFTKDGKYEAEMNPASSWSTIKGVAETFSLGADGDSANAFLLSTQVKASDIISTARTGMGSMREGEVVVRNYDGLTVNAERQVIGGVTEAQW